MIEVTIGKKRLTMYSSIKELPVWLSKRQQLYAMQAAGIGNSVADWDSKVGKVMQYLEAKRLDDAVTELKNVRLTVYSAIEGLDYKSLAFACMVQAEDGELLTDYSEAALLSKLDAWAEAGLTNGDVDDVLHELKKNLIPNG
jgi:hypothetical protein